MDKQTIPTSKRVLPLGAGLKKSGASYRKGINTEERPKEPMAGKYLNNGETLYKCMLGKVKLEMREPNLSYVLDYSKNLRISGKDLRTIARQLRELRFIIKELGKKDAKKADESDIKEIVLAVTESKIAPISKRKILLTLRVFFGFINGYQIDEHEYPEIVKSVKVTIRNLRKPIAKSEKTSGDLPLLDEIKKMVEVADYQLEKALVMLFASTGARVGEVLALKMSSLQLESDPNARSHIVFTGKTGTRTTPLFTDAVPFLKKYVEEERKDAKPDEPLFIYKGRALDFDNVRFILRKLAARAKVKHRIHSHIFRYYIVTYLISIGKNTSQIAKFIGDRPATVAHYEKLADSDSIMDEGSAKPSRRMLEEKECAKCHALNEFNAKVCVKCSSELHSVADDYNRVNQELVDLKSAFNALVGSLNSETRQKIAEVLGKE